MKRTGFLFYVILVIVSCWLPAITHAVELDKKKMEDATTKILDIFKKQPEDKSDQLKKFVSQTWIGANEIDLKKYSINTYSPSYYSIYGCGSDFCVVEIGGKTWAHILVFQFSVEKGVYKVIPRGISLSSSNYIDPWMFVKDNFYKKE